MFEFSGARATGDFSIGLGSSTVRLQDLPSARPRRPRRSSLSLFSALLTLHSTTLLLSLLLSLLPPDTTLYLQGTFPFSTLGTSSQTRHSLFRFECHRCRAHSYALHPLLSLTSRRGRQRSTLPDSLSFNLQCRVSHAQVRSSPSDEQTNNHDRQFLPNQSLHNADNCLQWLNGHNGDRQWPCTSSSILPIVPLPFREPGGGGR